MDILYFQLLGVAGQTYIATLLTVTEQAESFNDDELLVFFDSEEELIDNREDEQYASCLKMVQDNIGVWLKVQTAQ